MRPSARGMSLMVLVVTASAVLGGIYGPSAGALADDASEVRKSADQFSRVLSIVQKNYADPVDVDKAVFEGAIPGMMRVLDPHSNFYDARQFNAERENFRGKYYGVGMTVAPRRGRTIVLAPMLGSPAYRAGIRPGDVILRVDGAPTDGLTTPEVADRLKGPKGTIVRITVGREGSPEPLEFTITRDEIARHGVENVMLIRPGIGYLRVVGFNETTDRELHEALEKLNVGQLDGLIADLRGNPGGLLNEGVMVADAFLEKNQLIVSHRGRSSPERRYYATRGNRGVEVPLVVLINGQSASASEIVAGAVQDHDRGFVVGDTSFGKGLVQTVYNLSENTGLALTTAKYYTPSGRLIQRDYKAISLYDYYYQRNKTAQGQAEVKLTDGGREVYGGGGITPDEVVPTPRFTPFQELLLRREVFFPFELGVGGFARYYLGQKPQITKEFTADENLLNELRRYLDRENIRFAEADIQENKRWIQQKIKRELFLSVFGTHEGFKVLLEDDAQVQRAIELLPRARELYANAKRVLAQRQAGKVSPP